MRVTNCHEVYIRFSVPSMQGVRVTRNDGLTSCHYIRVENDGVTLALKFCDKDGDVRKEINYNFQHVAEYDCVGWVSL